MWVKKENTPMSFLIEYQMIKLNTPVIMIIWEKKKKKSFNFINICYNQLYFISHLQLHDACHYSKLIGNK